MVFLRSTPSFAVALTWIGFPWQICSPIRHDSTRFCDYRIIRQFMLTRFVGKSRDRDRRSRRDRSKERDRDGSRRKRSRERDRKDRGAFLHYGIRFSDTVPSLIWCCDFQIDLTGIRIAEADQSEIKVKRNRGKWSKKILELTKPIMNLQMAADPMPITEGVCNFYINKGTCLSVRHFHFGGFFCGNVTGASSWFYSRYD